MSISVDVPILGNLIDYPYVQTILGGTAIGTYQLTSFYLPKHTLGQIILIENQSPINGGTIVPYLKINDTEIPKYIVTQHRQYLKVDRPYYEMEYIKGGSKIEILYDLTSIPIANIQAVVRLQYWYVDLDLLRQMKDRPDIRPYYDIWNIMVNNKNEVIK